MPATDPNPGQQGQPASPAADPTPRITVPPQAAAPPERVDLRLEEDLLDQQENLQRTAGQTLLNDVLLVALYVVATAVLIGGVVWAVRGRLW